MPSYKVCGLILETNFPLLCLAPLTTSPRVDVGVYMSEPSPSISESSLPANLLWHVSRLLEPTDEPYLKIWLSADGGYHFAFTDGSQFWINPSGSQVWMTWPEQYSLEFFTPCLLGTILGFLLHLRGIPCLHGGAISVQGQAIVIVGNSGAGKSTLTAALAARGYGVLTDDLVPLILRNNSIWVQPTYPQVRLWPDSVTALFGTPDRLPVLAPEWPKQYLDFSQPEYIFQDQPLPVGRIYLLGDRSDQPSAPQIEPLELTESLLGLVTNLYTANFPDPQMRASSFELFSQMVRQIPIRRLTPHRDISRLSQMCDLILADCENLTPGAATASSVR
jgi:hypothetical protein